MVMDRVRAWAIVSVWVRFRVGVWDMFRLRLEVIRIRIRVRLRVRVIVAVSGCFWGLQ